MTLLQIEYVLSCATYGSISKAADEHFTTPSNVSKSLKALEDELNYSIFIRKNKELVPTEQGIEFLRYATSMMQEYKNIQTIGRPKTIGSTLSICSNQIPYVKYALMEYWRVHQSDPRINQSLYQGNFYYCLRQLEKYTCQLALLALYKPTEGIYLEELTKRGLTAKKIAKSNIGLLLRDGHPLIAGVQNLLDLAKPNTVNWEQLKDYPYVNYQQVAFQDEILSPFSLGREKWPINPAKMITTNNMALKCEFVRNTDAFTFTSSLYDVPHCERGLVIIPDPTVNLNYYYVSRANTELPEHVTEFLRFFKDEMALRKHFH